VNHRRLRICAPRGKSLSRRSLVPTLSDLLAGGCGRSVRRGWIGERRKKCECAWVRWKQITGFVWAEKPHDRWIQMSGYRWSGLNRPRWENKIPAQPHNAACASLREEKAMGRFCFWAGFELWTVKFHIFFSIQILFKFELILWLNLNQQGNLIRELIL
jgi:hypothetical protein